MSEKLIPLKFVQFKQVTPIPGTKTPMLTVTAMEQRVTPDGAFVCPQPFLDPDGARIKIENMYYPIDSVRCYETASMARSKPLPAEDLDRYTIGKRAPRRFAIAVDDVTDLGPVTRKPGPKD